MATIKQERLNQIILREVTNIIHFELKDPSIGFITISDVDVSNDHSFATIYVSFLGKQTRKDAGLNALNKAKGFIRSELAKRLTTRRVPSLIFKLDDTLENAEKLNKIFQKIDEEKES
ncbi:MAG: 30S ribosome-binding factor RbfA [Erysipelotrichaceae bacterium]|nr:30S ribosome-binding factor RbfA [Erysipelotrichaceae bacterium]